MVASPTDGECFGELALIDFNKIKTQDSHEKSTEVDVKRRAGTCTTCEETFMLRIDNVKARDIL